MQNELYPNHLHDPDWYFNQIKQALKETEEKLKNPFFQSSSQLRVLRRRRKNLNKQIKAWQKQK